MDANGLKFWSFSSRRDWFRRNPPSPALHYCDETRSLQLAEEGPEPALSENEALAAAVALKPARVKDAMGTVAYWDAEAGAILASGGGASTVEIDKSADAPAPTDLALGSDDILYVARGGPVDLIDRRGRWRRPVRVSHASFAAHKLAPAPDGGVWALDRVNGSIARLIGTPLRDGVFAEKKADVFTPVEPNPDPPRLIAIETARLPAGKKGVCVACSVSGEVAVLALSPGGEATVFVLADGKLEPRFSTRGLSFPASIAWIGDDNIAVLATDGDALAKQVFVYNAAPNSRALPTAAIYPLIGARQEPFINVQGAVPSYAVSAGGFLPLRAVSAVTYARNGTIELEVDSASPGTVWHRLYLEAIIPEHCGIKVGLRTQTPAGEKWFPHVFGAQAGVGEPAAAWLDAPSELPQHPGLLGGQRVPGRAGLFSVLIQCAGVKVRRLAGRRLFLRIELVGNGHLTPQLAGLRVYAGRFSYRDRYLPRLYHETLDASEAGEAGSATGPDFLERFLGLIEEPLTQIEGRIAEADLLTDPSSTPAAAVPWLAQWVGLELDDGATGDKDRQRLRAAPYTARLRGTLGGLRAALELETGGVFVQGGTIDMTQRIARPGELALASIEGKTIKTLVLAVTQPGSGMAPAVLTGGGVTRGEIVVIEGFRLRRTFATILGARLGDEGSPLTLGMSPSGNSIVGDTLFLGDESRREFLAIFADGRQFDPSDREAVRTFFDALAWRVTVLAHETAAPRDLARLQRVAEAASPAYVEVSVKRAAYPFLVGVASLIGADTFLAETPPPRDVEIGRSLIGVSDFLGGQGLLDGRRRYASTKGPAAIIDGPATILEGQPFTLSGLASRAPDGGWIEDYIWTWLEGPN